MCPRPRTATDAELLMAAARAVSRVGPVRLTLADVSREAGVAPATLIQRFGSKRGLLLAFVRAASGGAAQEMAALRAAHPSPLAAVYAFAECLAGMAPTPEELANHLAFLVMDLTDPEFHHHTLEQSRVFLAELEKLLEEAVSAKELTPCDTTGLARLVNELTTGALVAWAIHREGTAREWVRREMELLLQPYLPTSPSRRSPKRRRG